MKKIPTLYLRDYERTPPGRYLTRTVTPGCEWVLAGEGVPTRKLDGVCVRIEEGGNVDNVQLVWFRREVKGLDILNPPLSTALAAGFVLSDVDATTGKTTGWEPAASSGFLKLLLEALAARQDWEPGTYELLGPKINRNPEGEAEHVLRRHGGIPFDAVTDAYDPPPLDYDGLRDFLLARPFEGIVWHHPDGRMAKIKRRDFE